MAKGDVVKKPPVTFENLRKVIESGIQPIEYTKNSLRWWNNFIKQNIQRFNSLSSLQAGTALTGPKPGSFMLYMYDPKYKATLPYYDTFPLILCTGVTKTKNGINFHGINFHYLSHPVRLILMEAIFKETTITSGKMRMAMSWAKAVQIADAVGKDKYLKHAIKQYIFSGKHIKSNMIEIDAVNLEALMFLPIARFKKTTERHVWGDA